MSNQQPKQRIQVPDSLRDVLLEFSIAYLLEQPGDVVDYAVEFFSKLQDSRNKTMVHTDEVPSPDESIMSVDEEPLVNRFATRRKSVFAETYDPENDADEDEGAVAIFPKSDEQRSRLIESVRNILLFRSLDKEQMNQVLDAMFERKVTVDETVIRQGDDGDNFYVIESGTYKAFVGENHIHTYNNSGSFGELALLYNMPRAATIKAETVGQLWAMDRQTFRRILLKSAFRKRKMYESLLDTVPMLKTLQSYERLNLADALAPKSFTANERIIKQGHMTAYSKRDCIAVLKRCSKTHLSILSAAGCAHSCDKDIRDAADGMYFIEDGTVSIRLNQDDGEVEISRLSKGAYFGELALVTHRPRAASAYAVENVKVAFLDVDAFERLLGPCMDIMKRNIGDYEAQLIKIFGSKNNIKDVR